MSNEDVAALVRAIRQAHPGEQYGGIVQFEVRDIFAFAAALIREGVTVQQKEAA
jgi:S-adenosylmethionine hydrolase